MSIPTTSRHTMFVKKRWCKEWHKGRPYGTDDWVSQMVAQWTLQATVREPGRPRKHREIIPDTV